MLIIVGGMQAKAHPLARHQVEEARRLELFDDDMIAADARDRVGQPPAVAMKLRQRVQVDVMRACRPNSKIELIALM